MSITRAIIAAVAMLIALLAWFFLKTGDPNAKLSEDSGGIIRRRRTRSGELLATRKKVQRQIEQLENPVRGRDRHAVMARQSLSDLRDILKEIDAELRELDAGQ